jgi:NAD(P)-dependent dehydrogenase (short-subunit alcohol dehydrogenase family)
MSPGSPSTRRYENRVCAITCAGSGIGCAIALWLAKGGTVIPADIDADAAAQTVEGAREY